MSEYNWPSTTGSSEIKTYAAFANFPSVGETGIAYIALDTDYVYLWDTSTLAYISQGKVNATAIALNTAHRTSDGKNHSDVVSNNAHRASDGKSHSDVVLNNTHRTSNGTDHSNVVLNDTHRGSDGSDHSIVGTNQTHATGNGSDHANVATNTAHSTGDGSDHSGVALLAGRAGGQTINGGTASGNSLVLESTSNATKGNVEVSKGQLLVDYCGTGSAISWAHSTLSNNCGNFKLAINAGGTNDSFINFVRGGSNKWSIFNDGGSSDAFYFSSQSGGNVFSVVQATSILTFLNNLNIAASKSLTFNGVGILVDSAGTMTLSNIDAIDATTKATLEAALTGKQNDVITTRGDLIRGSSGNAAERLALGSNGQVLTSDGTDAAWGAAPESLTSTYATKSTDYTILDDDGYRIIYVDDTSTDRTATLPTASANDGRVITIKNISTDKGKVTVDGENTETIDGVETIDLDFKNAYIEVQCDGSNWQILNTNLTSILKSYSLTVTSTDWTSDFATGRPYRDISGNWFLEFNIDGDFSSGKQNPTFTITNVVFSSSATQAVTIRTSGAVYSIGQATGGASTIYCESGGSNTVWRLSGNVLLNAKPAFVE